MKARPPLEARHHAVDRLLHVRHADVIAAAAGGEERGLVDERREVGAREPRRGARDDLEVHVAAELDVARVEPEDREAPAHVGPVHDDLPVEATRPQDRGVEHLGPVRRGEHDHAAGVAAKKHAADPGDDFYMAKLVTARHYFPRILPRVDSHAAAARAGSTGLMALTADQFAIA